MSQGLNSPLQLGPILLRNRNIMSPLTRDRAVPATVPTDLMLEYYKQRAEGGAGLIISEGTLITPQGAEWEHAPGIWDDEHVAAWKKITDAVHEAGGYMFSQLWHLGRLSHPDMPEQRKAATPVWAPSAISARGGKFRTLPGQPGYVTPTEIPDPHIIISQFKHAAIKAKEAGFDGVELHGAGGYIVQQFLDITSNQRTDEWGGSVENRSRFLFEVVKVLVEIWGPDRVGVKLMPTGGHNDVGMSLEDTLETYTHVIKRLDEFHIAYVVLVRYAPGWDDSYDGKLRSTQHDVVRSYGLLFKNTRFFLNGSVTPDQADCLIRDGIIDGAVFGSLWISHPDLHRRIQQGKPLDAVVDFKHIYGSPGIDLSVGYTDYPTAT